MAMRSREIWVELLTAAGWRYFENGSLHATYLPEEAAVGQEFAGKAPALGYDCAWLDAKQALERSSALCAEGLLGALWSSTELTVDPRVIIRELPKFLQRKWGVEFRFNSPVKQVGSGSLETGDQTWKADAIVVAAGDDFQTLLPECFHVAGLTRSKLQMMRTVRQPAGWLLGPSLAFGLSFRHYPTFQICETLPTLKQRIARESPELDQWGIHVMVSQNALGELTLGDSHEYGLAVDIFDKPHINNLILDYARRHLRLPSLEIAETWHGVYASHPEIPYLVSTPTTGVRMVIVTSGIGMTMSFGLAESTLTGMGVLT